MEKQDIFNSIFLRRRRKIFVEEKGNLDILYQENLERAVKSNDFLCTSQNKINVKQCELLNCSIIVNNNILEYENGNLKNKDVMEDKSLTILNEIVKEVTEMIRVKLNVALTLNQNISKLGFCMDPDLLKTVALYNEKEILKFSNSLIAQLKKLVGADVEYISLFPNFPQQVIDMSLFTVHFYRWLYYVNICVFGNNKIPYDFEIIEKEKTEIKDLDLKVISLGEKKEFYDMIVNIMNSAEAISPQDITDLEAFFYNEDEYLKFIPEIIKNKENLVNITKLILKSNPEPPINVLLPKYNNVNDVLRLALVLSDNNASDIGKSVRFKSFKNSERRLLMKLLDHCGNRYEDFMKYKNIWNRFCEKVHPGSFKKIYPDLVDDLLGDYRVKENCNCKEERTEYRYYKSLYKLDNQVTSGQSIDAAKNKIERFKNLNTVPDNIRKNIDQYISAVDKGSSKNLIKRIRVGPPKLNEKLINERMKELEPEILILHEKARQYRHERQTLDSKIVELISNKQINEAAKLLSQKPGVYLRRLDELITKSENYDTIIELFETVASKASTKVLLSVKGYFKKRNEKLEYRSFLIKGSDGSAKKIKGKNGAPRRPNRNIKPTTVIYYTNKVKEPLESELCERIIQICDQALINNFSSKSKLNGVYVSPDLEKILIPQDLRSASSSLESYTKGSRFDLSFKNITPEEKEQMIKDAELKLEQEKKDEQEILEEIKIINEKNSKKKDSEAMLVDNEKLLENLNSKLLKVQQKVKDTQEDLNSKKNCPIGTNYNKVRLFIWWTNSSNDRSDIIDLSVLVFDEKLKVKAKVAWNYLKNDKFQIYHSGDFIDGGKVDGKGVSEFIDLDTEAIVANGGRYVVIGVISYSGPNLKEFPNCKFGWMERQELRSNEFFEPSTVRQKNEVKYEGKAACPAILDCKTHELIWIDTVLAKTGSDLCIEQLQMNIKAILTYYVNPMRLPMADLINLHVQARDGEKVEKVEDLKEGDTAFVSFMPYSKVEGVNYISSTDLDIILSEYMA